MALTIQGERETEIDELSEINVMPFIDVILVLLIIFMVAAPLSTVDIAVDLPVSNAVQQPRPDKQVFLTVKGDMTLAIGEEPLARETLARTLYAQTGGEFGLDAEARQHGGDLRTAAMNDHRIDRGLLQKHDVAGELAGEVFFAHGVAAVFNDDGFLVVLLHMRQRFGQNAGLILRAYLGHEANLEWRVAQEIWLGGKGLAD